MEEGGERWSKPHVATLSLHSLFELRKGILSGTVMLDLDATNIMQITGKGLFTRNVWVCFNSKRQEWVLWQQVMVFTLNI